MNNSLPRLIDGMVETLRSEVIPQIGSEFARGQAYGVIYMLNSIRLRAEWSGAFYREQLAAQIELRDALKTVVASLDAPALPETSAADADAQAMEALRDTNDGRICELIAWHAEHANDIGKDRAAEIEAALHRYMERQLRFELATMAKPMFAEISSGAE